MDKIKCPICRANFAPQKQGQTKCVRCEKEHPNENSLAEVLEKGKPKTDKSNLTEEKVKLLVYRVLEEAHIVRVKCEDCGQLYFKKSPAQKYCPACQAKRKETDK